MEICNFKDISGETALEIVYKLVDAFNCRVCNMVLTPDLLTCDNGHSICLTCKNTPSKCYVCSQPLNSSSTSLLAKILQHLPRECRNNSCPATILPRDNHDYFCGFKDTNCQLCDWVGPRKDLPTHVSGSHLDVSELGEGVVMGSWDNFDPNEKGWKVWPLCIRGQFFWKFMRIELSKNILVKEYFWVPNGMSSLRVQVKVEFKDISGKVSTSNTTHLNPSSSWSQSTIYYALSSVKNFIDKKKTLRWTEVYTVLDCDSSVTPPLSPNNDMRSTPPTTPNKNKRSPVDRGVKVLPDSEGNM